MTTTEILDLLNESDEIQFANGFEDALLGTVVGALRPPVACYDYDKCIEILVQDGMDEETAVEYLEFNTIGAYAGKYTPLFLHNLRNRD